jgi:Na+-translocating ferredoxin:NAD+ oxidoreductase RnfG subunit
MEVTASTQTSLAPQFNEQVVEVVDQILPEELVAQEVVDKEVPEEQEQLEYILEFLVPV